MLLTLRFANEVLVPVQVKNTVRSGNGSVSSAELSMAKKLVDQEALKNNLRKKDALTSPVGKKHAKARRRA
jgi:hypothetical protein